MAARRYWRDDSKVLMMVANQLIADEPDFISLKKLSILYAWVDPPEEQASTGRILEGQVRKLTPRERDFFGFDIAIVVAESLWLQKTAQECQKLMWHELNHIQLDDDFDEPQGLALDKAGRIVIKLRKHDLNLERFDGELRKFGVDEGEKRFIDRLCLMPGYAAQVVGTTSPCICGHTKREECGAAGIHLHPSVGGSPVQGTSQSSVRTSVGASG
jgi:hypothetical protein